MEIPAVTPEHIEAFQKAHFGLDVQALFAYFLPHRVYPSEESSSSTQLELVKANQERHGKETFQGEGGEEESDDDGLGYYPDGVKRTLTDEQIAIFRFSETQEMLREQQRVLEAEAKRKAEEEEEEEEEKLLAAQMKKESSENFRTQDYMTMNQRNRPQVELAAGSLPWDDGDIGEWETTQIKERQMAEARELEKEKTSLSVKPTYDPASGREFLWPVLGGRKRKFEK